MPQPPGAAWDSLKPGLTDWIAEVIAQQGWERMTPVQAGSIPRALKNQDCVVEVSTGSSMPTRVSSSSLAGITELRN